LTIKNNLKFIDAISFKNSGDYEKAVELLNQIINSKGDRAPAYFELAKIYTFKSKNQQALQFVNKAVDLNSKNKWYLNYKINLSRDLGLYKQCESAYLLRRKMFPLDTDYDIELSDFYIDRKEYLKALKILNQLEVKLGISHHVNFNKFILYKGLEENDQCENEIQKLIVSFPSKAYYHIQFADFKFELGEDSSALKIYDEALELNPENPYILNELAHYYYKDHQIEKSKSLYIQVVKNIDFNLSEKHKILLKFKRLSELDNRLKDFTKSLMILAANLHPYDSHINLITADFIYESRRYKESIKYYQRVVDSKPSDYVAWLQLVTSYYDISNYGEMLKKSSDALELFPSQPYLYLYNGIANVQLKKYSNGIEILEEGNDLVLTKDKRLKAQFLSSLGDACHAIGKHQESDQYFELSLEQDSGNYFVLNNFAYYLSERNIHLEKAKKNESNVKSIKSK
jgi:tetratricopeptide (TPR) repeat protein